MLPTIDRRNRWQDRHSLSRPGAELFPPSRHEVALIDEATARPFVRCHHYSGSYPSARCQVGLFRAGVGLAGVAVFSVPPSQAVIPRWCGVEARLGVELGRLVLLDEVEGNGETWFMRRAFALLAERLPDVRAVLAFADPFPRQRADGTLIKPGHIGLIYQAHNGRYLGQTPRNTLYLTAHGQVFSRRAVSKLRAEESGWRYAVEQLQEAGAPRWCPGESGAAYWLRVRQSGVLRRVRHPGNHVYLWPLGDRRQRRHVLDRCPPALPIPKVG